MTPPRARAPQRYGSAVLPYELIGLGQTFLAGSGFFTKIIMAFLLYETRQGVKEMRQVKPILQAYKRALVASFVVFVVGLDADLRPEMGRAALLYGHLVDVHVTLDPGAVFTWR